MRLLIICLFSVLLNNLGFSQATDSTEWRTVEVQPEFPGGMGAFYKFVADELTYPNAAIEQSMKGRVFVQFIVDDDGSIIDDSVKTVRGEYELLNREAERIMRSCPDWIPGRLSSTERAVQVRVVMPIIFKLPD